GCRAFRMAGSVIAKDCGKWSLAFGVEEPGVESETVAWHDHGFRFLGSSVLGDQRHRNCQYGRCQSENRCEMRFHLTKLKISDRASKTSRYDVLKSGHNGSSRFAASYG